MPMSLLPKRATLLLTGTLITIGLALSGNAMAGQNNSCLTGTVSSEQQRIDCAGRWVSADGTRFGPQILPHKTPRTPHPAWRSAETKSHGHEGIGASRTYSTHHARMPAPVWTPPEPYHQDAPVVVTRGNHANTYDGSYDIYVPTHHAQKKACGRHNETKIYCDTDNPSLPIEGCFTQDTSGQTHSVPCPIANTHSTATYGSHVQATAHASASANVNISSAGFFSSLSGGVGGGGSTFYGGGGGVVVTGGGGSVLSRAPLIRFRSRHRGRRGGGHHGGGCGCSGGGMMGMGGGD